MNITIHETSIIDDGAQIGEGTKVWHWTHVCSGAKIGKFCSLGQNVFVGANATLGNNVKVQNNVSIYDEVYLGDNVFCGPSVVFTNVINPRSEIIRKTEYKKTIVQEGASLGANSTIICGVKIGKYSFVGAGAVVTKNVPDFALVVGVPAKQIGWVSRFGTSLDLPLNGQGSATCSYQGDKYVLEGNSLRML